MAVCVCVGCFVYRGGRLGPELPAELEGALQLSHSQRERVFSFKLNFLDEGKMTFFFLVLHLFLLLLPVLHNYLN